MWCPRRVRDQLNAPATSAPAPSAPAAAPAQQTIRKPAAPARSQLAAGSLAPSERPAPAAKHSKRCEGNCRTMRPAVRRVPAQKPVAINRRDPFDSLLTASKPGTGIPENLPPGKAGLMVSTLQIDGIVRGKGGMIVIVSNPQKRVYFLREGDKLYDGSVEHVTLDEVAFHQVAKDAFGKPIERQVTKRLYPSPGEQR